MGTSRGDCESFKREFSLISNELRSSVGEAEIKLMLKSKRIKIENENNILLFFKSIIPPHFFILIYKK
jgi:hypothetical protein